MSSLLTPRTPRYVFPRNITIVSRKCAFHDAWIGVAPATMATFLFVQHLFAGPTVCLSRLDRILLGGRLRQHALWLLVAAMLLAQLPVA